MLIPDRYGDFYYDDQKCIHYYAFVDPFDRIIEAFTTEDGVQRVGESTWDELNDIEKAYARQRGWDLGE